MDSQQFSTLRRKLEKTQKQLAELMGTSLKAICSYEQGWRKVPAHVERQIYFLLSRKKDVEETQKNCWDIMDCPDERKLSCPSWEFNAGKFCWFINGTICTATAKKNWDDKFAICRECPVMADIIN